MDILGQLSEGGRAIITTIHQPSSRLYQTLDKLLLLSQVHQQIQSSANLWNFQDLAIPRNFLSELLSRRCFVVASPHASTPEGRC
jgi:hypothetical protein